MTNNLIKNVITYLLMIFSLFLLDKHVVNASQLSDGDTSKYGKHSATFSSDFINFIYNLESKIYKANTYIQITTPTQSLVPLKSIYKKAQIVEKEDKDTLSDVLMMKLVSYYEHKYKLLPNDIDEKLERQSNLETSILNATTIIPNKSLMSTDQEHFGSTTSTTILQSVESWDLDVNSFKLLNMVKAFNNSMPRIKRAHIDNFNILLDLYKLNPLKHSKIYETFSNNLLLTSHINKDINKNYTKIKEIKDDNVKTKENEVGNKIGNLYKEIHKVNLNKTVPFNDTSSEHEIYFENSKEELFDTSKNWIYNTIGNGITNDENIGMTTEKNKVDNTNYFNYIMDHLESEEPSEVIDNNIAASNVSSKVTRMQAQTKPTTISIPDDNLIESVHPAKLIEEKVENNFIVDDTNNDVIVLR